MTPTPCSPVSAIRASPARSSVSTRATATTRLERADLLPFYGGNSLLVFDRGQPFVRRDFEAIERIEVR